MKLRKIGLNMGFKRMKSRARKKFHHKTLLQIKRIKILRARRLEEDQIISIKTEIEKDWFKYGF